MQCLSEEKKIINKSFSDKDLQDLCFLLKKETEKNKGKLKIKITYNNGFIFEGDNKYIFKNKKFKTKKVKEIRYKLTSSKGEIYIKLRLKSCKRSYYIIKSNNKTEFNYLRKTIEEYLDEIENSSILQIATQSYSSFILSSLIIFILLLGVNIYFLKLKNIITIFCACFMTLICTTLIYVYYPSTTLKRYNANPVKLAIINLFLIVLTELIGFYIEKNIGGLLNG